MGFASCFRESEIFQMLLQKTGGNRFLTVIDWIREGLPFPPNPTQHRQFKQ